MKILTLEQIIRSHTRLGRVNSNGWYPALCKVCHDHGKKGDRAAFLFTPSGGCSYHCFNCGHSAGYDPQIHRTMPHKMLEVLSAFGVADVEWQPLVFSHWGDVRKTDQVSKKHKSIEPASVELPKTAIKLAEATGEIAEYAREYLAHDRHVDWKQYPFYICEDKSDSKWFGRLIIPIYKDKTIVFFQGRDLSGLASRKYLSPSVDRDRIIYGYDHLFTNADEPLYVVEGWFDAYLVGGVAVFGNKMFDEQVKWLTMSPRKKVIIPDTSRGYPLAQQAISLGWSISTPDAPGCGDVSDIVTKYGMLYTLRTIQSNTCSGFEAEVRAKLFCSGAKK